MDCLSCGNREKKKVVRNQVFGPVTVFARLLEVVVVAMAGTGMATRVRQIAYAQWPTLRGFCDSTERCHYIAEMGIF